ncbi:LL-diaminopimelate aminotransferase [Aureliella helgolandensis]|uniref:LL-diaminopimelate aminotransferase n=1 Tax=Aureliella helgolandensis TaxID=2527968 RepID=A0A518G509_9BACT|nr:LL-diaminopimelate aminotransferase [Aureliella helgolandensis]QDV23686.1 LL-diaminopimelate aminotransferase [Aureliella helgolandensis]
MSTGIATDPYFQQLFSDRIGGSNYGKGTAIYKFEKIKRAKRKALADYPHRELIDFGIGENDSMAAESVRQRMAEEINKPENRGYADNGIASFKEAAARFMQRRLGVQLDPVTEINHCIGSKTALSMLPACLINPGDVTLMTAPGYPVAGTHTKYYGGSVVALPLLAENQFFPDFSKISAETWERTKLLVLNYPNSPTGKTATREFYQEVVELAHRHQFVVAQDAAHMVLSFDQEPLSFLSIDGAREVGVEIHSMSKGFDMIGWRIGWVCGHSRLIQAFADVKDNCDSGQFAAIQQAAAFALDSDDIPNAVREKYRRRLQKLVAMLKSVGFQCEMPGGTYFLYTPTPAGTVGGLEFANAEEASQHLITEQSIVTVPWDDAGPFLRFSVTYVAADEAAEDALMAETAQRLKSLGLQF